MSVRIFRLGGTELRLNLLSVPIAVAAYILGEGETLVLSAAALMLHELAHTAVAYACGIAIVSVELMPLGFVARLSGDADRMRGLSIASAGPLFSIATGMMCYMLSECGLYGEHALEFGRLNAALGFINLLPVLPLDGGRMVEISLSYVVSEKTASLIPCVAALITSAMCFMYTVVKALGGQFVFLYAALGILLSASAISELRERKNARAKQLVRSVRAVRYGGTLSVKTFAVSESMTVRDALYLFSRAEHVRLVLLDGELHETAVLGEAETLRAMAELGGDTTLRRAARMYI